jgi:hypothetical protein
VSFEHLPYVHARRHTQRIQNDIHRRSVRQKRHVFLRHDLRHHTLVSVASCHLVTDRQLPLGSDVNLHGLDHAAVNSLTRLSTLKFLVVLHLEVIEFLLKAADDLINLVADR